MITSTALLAAAPLPADWYEQPGHDARELPGQVPLPFPGVAPVLPAPIERDDIGPLRDRCARFMQALVEVLSGERPSRQMQTWLSPDVYETLTRRLNRGHGPVEQRPRARRSPARLVSVHVSMVDEQIAEIAARMVHRGRSRAVAVRLEPCATHRGDRVWRCTALEWA